MQASNIGPKAPYRLPSICKEVLQVIIIMAQIDVHVEVFS